MKIHEPVYWCRPVGVDYGAKQIKMSAILPKTGRTIQVSFYKDESPAHKENLHVLWKPPATEMNGWSDQPSDILHSYIVTGQVQFLRQFHRSKNDDATLFDGLLENSMEYEMLITDVQPFLSICDLAKTMPTTLWQEHYGSKTVSGLLQAKNDQETLFDYIDRAEWGQVRNVGMANLGNYFYLHFTQYEEHYDVLLQQEGKDLFVHYFSVDVFNGIDRYITHKKLTAGENAGIKSLMARAVVLEDSFGDYLLVDE